LPAIAAGRWLAVLAVLFALPGGATAQDAPDPQDDEGDPPLALGWDAGLAYDVELPRSWLGPDTSAVGRVGGTLYVDGGHVDGDTPGEGWDASVRRARVYTRGRISSWLRTEYKVELAFEDERVYLNDFYLRWRPRRLADTLTVGYMDPPFGLQTLVSSASRSLMEVGSPAAAFSPGYRLGVEAAGSYDAPDLSWFVNLATVGQRQQTRDASSTPIRGTARVVWRPLGVEPRLLHLGVGVTSTGGGDVRFRARPESFLVPHLVDTGDVDGASTVVDLEAAWSRGPVSLQAELYYALLSPSSGPSLGLHGSYVQATWIVTGERRGYDRSRAVFRRVEPAVPFHPLHGGRGAFEVAGRLSWLDLSDGPLRGGRMLTFALGGTWTWNAWVRIQAGYVLADVRDRPDASFAHIVQARLELAL
jgi:phosphate-selective porin OprO/OprP